MITEEQKLLRMKGVGASDIPCIFGVGFKTARDLWLIKRGMVTESPSNEAMELGIMFEDDIVDWYERQIACLRLNRHVSLVGEEAWMMANLDAEAILPEGAKAVVEAKTAGLKGFSPKVKEWGEEFTDEIPHAHILQVQWQMFVAGPDYRMAYVPAMINDGGISFRMYHVRRDDALIADIVDGARGFWRMVEEGIEPAGRVSPDVARLIIRTPSSAPVPIADNLMRDYLDAQARAKVAEEVADDLKGRLIAALGQGDWGACSAGKVTYKSAERRGFDGKAFAADHPDLAKKYEKMTVYRTLRISAAK